MRSADESKLDIRVKICAKILEWQLEFLDSASLLDGQRDQFCAGSFIEQLLHAFDLWIIEESKQQDVYLPSYSLLLNNNIFARMTDEFLSWSCLFVTYHLDVNEGDDFGLETVFRCFYYDDEFLAHLWTNFESDLLLELL